MTQKDLTLRLEAARSLVTAGVRMLAGSDAGNSMPTLVGLSLHRELRLLVRSGLTPARRWPARRPTWRTPFDCPIAAGFSPVIERTCCSSAEIRPSTLLLHAMCLECGGVASSSIAQCHDHDGRGVHGPPRPVEPHPTAPLLCRRGTGGMLQPIACSRS